MTKNHSGFTIIELSIAIAIAIIVIVGSLTAAAETAAFTKFTDDNYVVQFEARRAFSHLSNILRKTGWSSDGTSTFPIVSPDAAELQFRILEDADSNGFAFDQTTGELEWSATVYTVRLDSDERTLYIFDGTTPIWTLGRHIDSISFATNVQDNTLHLRELRVTVQTSKDSKGDILTHTTSGSIHMRN